MSRSAVEMLRNFVPSREDDTFTTLRPVPWSELVAFLERRGDCAGPRIAYWRGALQLTSPSRTHEAIKTCLARLLETYALVRGIALNGYGSLTMKSEEELAGLEPDECYVVGELVADRPDIAIEVVWTKGAIRKLPIYRALGVREVWIWKKGVVRVHALRTEGYVPVAHSEVLPDLDLATLVSYVDPKDQTGAARRYFDALASTGR